MTQEMDHLSFLKSMSADTRNHLTIKSDRAGLKHLAVHFGWILVLGAYVAAGAPFWGLALVPLGICIIFLFTLLHETVHFTPFASARWNTVVGHVCSLLIIVPNTWFRYFHLAHHKYTNDPENDPELAVPKPQNRQEYFWLLTGLPYWVKTAKLIMDQCLGRVSAPYLPKRAERTCIWQARVMVAIYGLAILLVFAGYTWIFWCWMLPIVLGQPFLRAYLLAEHGQCPPVANMFDNTRTTFTNRLVRFLAWNMPYHAEHHVFPAVPFYKLPEFHDLTQAHLLRTSEGYSGFHEGFLKDL